MNLNKIKNVVKIVLFIIIVINIGITINILLNGPKDIQESKPVNDAPLKGIGLFVANQNDTDNIHNQIIDYSNINNYSYKFTNATGNDLNCTLSIFLNGTQVKLLNTEDNTIINNYTFSINNGEEKIMPLKLNLENLDIGSYLLTFNLVANPEDNAINRDEAVWTNSSYNYVLGLYNTNNKIIIPETQTALSINNENTINDVDCSQFIINYTKDEFNSESICKNYIEAKPNETLNIPIILGGGNCINKMVYGTLNCNQIPLSNSNVLIYNLTENTCGETYVTLTTPNSPGNYDLILYSIDNFNCENLDNVENLHYTSSNRITLIVK